MTSAKPLLILLHGAASTKAMWAPQVAYLKEEADLLTVDLPAHGGRKDEPFSFEAAAAHIADEIDRDGRSQVVLAGLSLGGYVAMDFASRHPNRITGLILSGCAIDYSRGSYPLLTRLNRVAVALYPKWILDRMNAQTIRSEYPQWADQLIAAGFFWSGFAQALGPLTKRYFPDSLGEFSRPILVIAGEKDVRNRKEEERFLKALRTADLVVLAGAGHICNLDDPAGFTEAIRKFLARLPTVTPSA